MADINKINNQLIKLQIKRNAFEKMSLRCIQAEKQLREELALSEKQNRMLQKEFKDYEKIKNFTLISIIHSLSGKRRKKLKKEEREYFDAKLKFEQTQISLAVLKKKLATLKKQKENIGYSAEDFTRLIDQKEKLLMKTLSEPGRKLIDLSHKIAFNSSLISEYEESLTEGKKVKAKLEEIKKSLKQAINLGVMDILFNDFISTSLKYKKIEETKKLINENQVLMNKFRKELSDLNQHVTLGSELEIGSFSRFADFFFDGFLIDLSIQSKLTHALKTVENFYSQVCQIVKSLTRTFSMLEEKRKALEKMHIKLIETATMDS